MADHDGSYQNVRGGPAEAPGARSCGRFEALGPSAFAPRRPIYPCGSGAGVQGDGGEEGDYEEASARVRLDGLQAVQEQFQVRGGRAGP